jgi:DUF971 family protein
MADAPTNIRAHQSEQIFELAWADGTSARLPYRYLRGECPCASCKDEWTGARILDQKTIRPDIALEGMEPVGNYAVRLSWNDGHSSGLYTWETLHKLSQECPKADG